jgi:type IV pilus assembly protein PilM
MTAMVWDKLKQGILPRGNVLVRSAIGFELALESLNLVQLEKHAGQKVRLNAWASVPLNCSREALLHDAKTLKTHLAKGFAKTGFHGREVNAMLPASELKIMSVNYATDNNEPAEVAIAALLQDRLDGDLADYVIDYLPVRRHDNQQRGLAVVAVAKRQSVINYLDCLHGAGLSVRVLDIGPAAIKRLVGAMHHPHAGETVLVINFGAQFSYLSIISGRRLLFDEEFAFGEQLLVSHISQALQMEEALVLEQLRETGIGHGVAEPAGSMQLEVADTLYQILRPRLNAIVDNVKRALVYAVSETRGEPISQIYLAGSLARWPGMTTIMNKLLDLPVSVLPDPLLTFGNEGEKAASCPQLALATGLALSEVDCHGRC